MQVAQGARTLRLLPAHVAFMQYRSPFPLAVASTTPVRLPFATSAMSPSRCAGASPVARPGRVGRFLRCEVRRRAPEEHAAPQDSLIRRVLAIGAP